MGVKLKIGLAAIAVAVLLSGCATAEGYRQHMDLYVGQSTDELLIEMGEPIAIRKLADGTEEWAYYKKTDYYVSGGTTTNTSTRTETFKEKGVKQTRETTYETLSYSAPYISTSSCNTKFIVDHGKVVSHSFSTDCKAEEIKK